MVIKMKIYAIADLPVSNYLYNSQCPVSRQDVFHWAEVFAETKPLSPNLTLSFETSYLCASSNFGSKSKVPLTFL